LIDYRCQWNFEDTLLLIKALPSAPLVRLEARIAQGCIRRIYAGKTVDLPARSQCVVLVKSIWNTLPPRAIEWVVEPKKLQPGILLARTLLAECGDIGIRPYRKHAADRMRATSRKVFGVGGISRHGD
jgi:hypothetical protein